MMRALYSSVAGLKTHQTKMDVIGNNIANVNTVGFKSSRVTFSTMMYQSMSGASGANAEAGTGGVNAKQIGLGTNFASTAVSIESGGASESTGFAFDLKITDTNTTSFYIVNNGSENVFTRAGAFYVDGAGNLCMESTGYTVMGWQVDANGNIRKDTVSPLKIMSPENQTSAPEFTTKAVASGILDDNNTNVNSDTGYAMNLNFFDNRGYSYTARFATQKTGDDNSGEYTINLTDILDASGNSIMGGKSLSGLFGGNSPQGSCIDLTDNYTLATGKSAQLNRLALGAEFDAENPQNSDKTFTFTAETINQYMSPDGNPLLPEGLGITVELQYTTPETPVQVTDDVTGKHYEHTITIRDRNGNDITSNYTEVDANNILVNEWITGDDTNGYKIVNNVTLASVLDNASTITIGSDTTIGDSGVKEIMAGLGLTEESQLQTLLGTISLDDFKNYRVRQRQAGDPDTPAGPYIFLQQDTTDPDTWNPVDLDTTTIVRPYTLEDFIQHAFIKLDVENAGLNQDNFFTTQLPSDAEVRYGVDGSCKILTPVTDGYTLKFSTVDGSLEYIGQPGNLTQTLRMGDYTYDSNEPIPFSNIVIDFSTIKNLANGSSCTAAISAGDGDADGKGKKVGAMIGLSVDQSGMIYGSYDNGNTVLLGQIAVARFANASGLESIGNNCFKTTLNSGDFDGIGVEISSDGSSINSGELEMSNVDLATEFTQMITTQRGYQANSRVISTSDSILEELVNLKR